jgi:hypothetical protein
MKTLLLFCDVEVLMVHTGQGRHWTIQGATMGVAERDPQDQEYTINSGDKVFFEETTL